MALSLINPKEERKLEVPVAPGVTWRWHVLTAREYADLQGLWKFRMEKGQDGKPIPVSDTAPGRMAIDLLARVLIGVDGADDDGNPLGAPEGGNTDAWYEWLDRVPPSVLVVVSEPMFGAHVLTRTDAGN